MLKCYYCTRHFKNIPDIFFHIKHGCPKYSDHGGVRCGLCVRFYSDIYTWRRHTLKQHRASTRTPVSPCKRPSTSTGMEDITTPESSLPTLEALAPPMVVNPCLVSDTTVQCDSVLPAITDILQNQFALMFSSLHGNPKMTYHTVQKIADSFNFFFENGLNAAMDQAINDRSLNECVHAASVMETLRLSLNDSFKPFKTVHSREQYFKNKGSLISPTEVVLGPTNNFIGRHPHPVLGLATGQLIHIQSVLQKLFSIPGLLAEMDAYIQKCSEQETLQHYTQSPLWKQTVKLAPEGGPIYPIFLYFDDFETGNPLGSHAGIHKLGAVYMGLPTLPLRLMSQLRYIFLVFLYHSADRLTYGNSIFGSVIREVNLLLSEGINVEIGSEKRHVRFMLGAILGDNLGLHSVLGFVEGFRANHPCRICNAHKTETESLVIEKIDLLRFEDDYNRDVKKSDVSTTGVKERCVFLDIKHFKLFWHVSVDALHDLFEGVCGYTMTVVIQGLLNENIFNLNYLNKRINEFPYGPDSDNKPPMISQGTTRNTIKFKMSASECQRFVRYFGLMVGHKVERLEESVVYYKNEFILKRSCNEYYQLYLLLHNIVDMIMTDRVYHALTELLAVYISDFHTLYMKLSEQTLKPKFHFLTHYPGMLRRFGPLASLWTMRYEAKHRACKGAAHAAAGRVNICKTVARKIQHQLNELFYKNSIESMSHISSKCGTVPSTNLLHLKEILNLPIDTMLTTHKFIYSKNNITYRLEDVLCITLDPDDANNPQFVKIKNFYYCRTSSEVYVHSTWFKTIGLDSHFCAYIVENSDNHYYFNIDELQFVYPNNLSPYPYENEVEPMKFMVTLRNYIG